MAHEIEIINGNASFFSHREPAWHTLGTITSHALTLDDALVTAGLDWQVYKTEESASSTVLSDAGVHTVTVDGKYVTYRDHKDLGRQGLGIVGPQYQVIQNRQIGELVEQIVDQSGGIWETGGSLYGGRRVFMSIKMPDSMMVGGQDATDLYIVVASSHDSTLSVTAITTAVRVVCNNTFSLALADASSKYVFRHSGDASFKIQEAREALALTFTYQHEYEKAMEQLLATPMSDTDFAAFTTTLLPTSQHTRIATIRAENVRATLTELWTSPTQNIGHRTAYGALNTVTEYDQWYKATKGPENTITRAIRNLTSDTAQLSRKATTLLINT